jgi:hypothetical protein
MAAIPARLAAVDVVDVVDVDALPVAEAVAVAAAAAAVVSGVVVREGADSAEVLALEVPLVVP